MATKKSIVVLFEILVILTWVLGSTIQVSAETMNFKFYTWAIRAESLAVTGLEGHVVELQLRGSFYVFEKGEVATVNAVLAGDWIKRSGSFTQYLTINFQDSSTIIIKSQEMIQTTPAGATSGMWAGVIIKGTGRFEGIKGTHIAKAKYLLLEKGEVGQRGYGEGTITYTLPSK